MQVTLKGNPVKIEGNFPQVGSKLVNFTLTNNELLDVNLESFSKKFIILNIFVSQDTPTCSLSMQKFNTEAQKRPDCAILCISKDLPFAFSRFCSTNNTNAITTLSAFRSPNFGTSLGVEIVDSPLRGLLTRAIIVANQDREVIYTELVPEISNEPNYEQCLQIINK